jgi:hypothetical protein
LIDIRSDSRQASFSSTINTFLAVFRIWGVEAQEMPASAKAAVLVFSCRE